MAHEHDGEDVKEMADAAKAMEDATPFGAKERTATVDDSRVKVKLLETVRARTPSTVSRNILAEETKKLMEKMGPRDHEAACELLKSTTNEFVSELREVVDGYMTPLVDSGIEGVHAMFGNVAEVYAMSMAILQVMNEGSCASDAVMCELRSLASALEVYALGAEKAVEWYNSSLKTNHKFVAEMEKCYLGIGKHHDMEKELRKPIQRLKEYPALLWNIVRFTPFDGGDHLMLVSTAEFFESVSRDVQKKIDSSQNRKRLANIQLMLDGYEERLDDSNRVYLHEGLMHKVNPRGKSQERYFFLFSDMLLWCKPKAGKKGFLFKGGLSLRSAVLRDSKDHKAFRFEILRLDTKKVYVLLAKSLEEKAVWIEKIGSAINQLVQPSKEEKARTSFSGISRDEISSPSRFTIDDDKSSDDEAPNGAAAERRSLEMPGESELKERVVSLEETVQKLLEVQEKLLKRIVALEAKQTSVQRQSFFGIKRTGSSAVVDQGGVGSSAGAGTSSAGDGAEKEGRSSTDGE